MPHTHKKLYEELLLRTNFLEQAGIRQRLWHVLHSLYYIPKCKHCNKSVKWDSTDRTYRAFCSVRCANAFVDSSTQKLSDDDRKVIISLSSEEIRTLRKHNPKLYTKLVNSTSFLPAKSPSMQRVWHVLNETSSIPVCQQCNTNEVKWDGALGNNNYRKYCSTSCSANSISTRDKFSQTCEQRYGHVHFNHTKISNALEYLEDRDWLVQQHHQQKKSLRQISLELDVDPTTITNYLKKHNIEIINASPSVSYAETQLLDFVTKYLNRSQIVTNDRTTISPYELDLLILDKGLAIEMCGGYWHSDQKKNKNYHAMKQLLCVQKNIKLLTIYDVEWNTKQDIVKSMILSRIHTNSLQKVDARKCDIIIPTTQQQRQFYNDNHIQGYVRSTISYALVLNNEIISMISFLVTNKNVTLNRFASKIFYNVRGGFSKLFAQGRKAFNSDIITYADLRWGVGDVYRKSGFDVEYYIKPTYNYISYKNNSFGEMYHRSLFQKRFLNKRLKNYDPTLTEFVNCDNNNLYRIWDCGKVKYRYKHEKNCQQKEESQT